MCETSAGPCPCPPRRRGRSGYDSLTWSSTYGQESSSGAASGGLSEHPFRILTLLVRHPGTLVTRDDLRRELWTEHTFVVRRGLVTGGWFLFDINTPLALRSRYVQTAWVEHPAFTLVQRGSLDADESRARLDFEWFIPSGRVWRHVRETFWHVSWSDAEIRQALRRQGSTEYAPPTALTCVRGLGQRREEPTRTTWPGR